MPILIVLVLTLGAIVGCAPDLPAEEDEAFYTLGYETGYSWGYWLTAEDKDRADLFWTPPDKVNDAQEVNPQVNVRDYYIPKGYWTFESVADARFPDGTPFNDKQKTRAMEAYNWGFYDGFLQGVDDYLEGRSYRFSS